MCAHDNAHDTVLHRFPLPTMLALGLIIAHYDRYAHPPTHPHGRTHIHAHMLIQVYTNTLIHKRTATDADKHTIKKRAASVGLSFCVSFACAHMAHVGENMARSPFLFSALLFCVVSFVLRRAARCGVAGWAGGYQRFSCASAQVPGSRGRFCIIYLCASHLRQGICLGQSEMLVPAHVLPHSR